MKLLFKEFVGIIYSRQSWRRMQGRTQTLIKEGLYAGSTVLDFRKYFGAGRSDVMMN
jgi:hypothetical protein